MFKVKYFAEHDLCFLGNFPRECSREIFCGIDWAICDASYQVQRAATGKTEEHNVILVCASLSEICLTWAFSVGAS